MHDDLPMRIGDFDAVFLEGVPDREQDLALDVGDAVLGVPDPEPQEKVKRAVAESDQVTDRRGLFLHARRLCVVGL